MSNKVGDNGSTLKPFVAFAEKSDASDNDKMTTTNTDEQRASLDDDSKPKTVRALLVNFCAETSAHGLPHLVGYSGWNIVRVVWLVIFGIAMCGELCHLSLLMLQYFEYESADSFRVSKQHPQFPAITICNANPVSEIRWDQTTRQQFSDYYNWAVDVDSGIDDNFAFYNRINSAKGIFENINQTEITVRTSF